MIIALGIAELVVRTFAPQLTFNQAQFVGLKVFVPSDVATFELLPNSTTEHFGYTSEFNNLVTINKLGFRGAEISADKGDVFRIMLFGDSMIFGWGVEDNETVPVNLQNYLNQLPVRKKVEVINAGFAGGRSPDSYYAYLMNQGLLLQPDLIIVNIFPFNDFSDLMEMDWPEKSAEGYPLKVASADKIVKGGREVFRKPTNWKYEVPFLRNTHLGILLFNFMEKKTPGLVNLIKSIFQVEEVIDRTNLEENAKCIYEQICPEKFQESFAKMKLLFKAFADVSSKSQIPVMISIMPEYEQVKSHKELKFELKDMSLPHVDMLPRMTKGNVESYYFGRDGHLTPLGTKRAAYVLLDYLIKNQTKLLPGLFNAKIRALEPG